LVLQTLYAPVQLNAGPRSRSGWVGEQGSGRVYGTFEIAFKMYIKKISNIYIYIYIYIYISQEKKEVFVEKFGVKVCTVYPISENLKLSRLYAIYCRI
jgi:hypothetical protein